MATYAQRIGTYAGPGPLETSGVTCYAFLLQSSASGAASTPAASTNAIAIQGAAAPCRRTAPALIAAPRGTAGGRETMCGRRRAVDRPLA